MPARVEPKTRAPYHWDYKDQNQQIKFRIDSASDKCFSPPFPITDVGSIVVSCRDAQNQNCFFKVQKRQYNQSILVVVE